MHQITMSTWRVPGLRLKLQSTAALYADKIGLSSPAASALCVHSLLRARIGPIFQQRASILRAILLSIEQGYVSGHGRSWDPVNL